LPPPYRGRGIISNAMLESVICCRQDLKINNSVVKHFLENFGNIQPKFIVFRLNNYNFYGTRCNDAIGIFLLLFH